MRWENPGDPCGYWARYGGVRALSTRPRVPSPQNDRVKAGLININLTNAAAAAVADSDDEGG